MRSTWILLVVWALSIAPLCSASITGVPGETPPPPLAVERLPLAQHLAPIL